MTHLDKLGMESIVEKIIPTVGLGSATEYDIPSETVEMLETDCNEDNEDIPESTAVESQSARESFRIIVCSVRGHLIS